jgi:hypothetical protein
MVFIYGLGLDHKQFENTLAEVAVVFRKTNYASEG